MALEIEVKHTGGKKVVANVGKFVIETDQAVDSGGDGSAPEPFMYFLASLATCAGIYVVGFCEARDIPTDGIRILQDHIFDEKTGKLTDVKMQLVVPPEFPEKYHKAVARVAGMCTVKKVTQNPPEYHIETVVRG